MSGSVVYAGRHRNLSGYGNAILLKHQPETFTYYAHLGLVKVNKGQQVTARQIIGEVGNTGKSNGAHLHLELMVKGKTHNPVPYLKLDAISATRVSDLFYSIKKSATASTVIRRLVGD